MNSWRDLLTSKIEEAKILVASISYDLACSVNRGASLAPSKLRELSYHLPAASKEGNSLKDMKIYDYGDLANNLSGLDEVYLKAKEILNKDKFNLFIGGDHSVSIPLQKAFFDHWTSLGKIPAIIHIDAHPDFCDVYEESKYSHACTNFRAIDNGYKFEDITLIGIRGYEEQEIILFNKHPELEIIKASTILDNGIEIVKKLIDKYDDRYAVYLSFDIDAIDPSFAPGTGTPEAFGISSYDMLKMIQYFIEKLPIKTMDIVEVSPLLDINDVTSWTALKIIYEVFNSLNKL
jgi:agmatinase